MKIVGLLMTLMALVLFVTLITMFSTLAEAHSNLWEATPTSTRSPTLATSVKISTPVFSASTPAPRLFIGIVNRKANLRAGPGTNFRVVGSARVGEKLEIVAQNPEGTWCQITSGAWIAAFLLDIVPNPTLPITPSPRASPTITLTTVVTSVSVIPISVAPTPTPITLTPTLTTPAAKGATGEIKGILVDKHTRKPIARIQLRLITYKGQNAEGKNEWYYGPNDPRVTTDATGAFSFRKVPPGDYSIAALLAPIGFPAPLKKDEEEFIILKLTVSQVIDLGEILVAQ
jgi:hypothetical protein